jgi:hypothetical protein
MEAGMFEEKNEIGDAVTRAMEFFKTRKRLDVVPWRAIEELAGFDRLHPHWVQFNKRFRRDFLRETGILVWPVNGVGLELVSHKDQLERCQRTRINWSAASCLDSAALTAR